MTTITDAGSQRRGERSAVPTPVRPRPTLPKYLTWPPSNSLILVTASLVGIFVLAWFSVLTRPAEAVAAVWWPASGLALGLGIRTPPRRLWLACVTVAAILIGPNLAQYGSVPVAIGSTFGSAAEMAIGTLILRAGARKIPTLSTRRDFAFLMLAIVNAATVYDTTIALSTLTTGDVRLAMLRLFSEGPRRAAGMLLVAPMFMRLPVLERRPGRVFSLGQVAVAATVAALVFGASGFPLAYLVIVPPVLGALWISIRWLLWEMIAIAVIASYASAADRGPFSFDKYGPTMAATLLQGFELTTAIIVLVISLTVASERRAAERAQRRDAEELKRAGDIQRALRPAELPSIAGWEAGAAVVSARQVGGDFYDLRFSGRFAAMTLGDVMGKGAGAGIVAAATRTALRASTPERLPSEVLANGVRILEDDLTRSSAFVTLGYALIDLESGDVWLADAGHGLMFVVGIDGRDVERIEAVDLPLGLGTEWTDVRTVLRHGESLLMVSDGVLERWGGSIEQLTDAIRTLRSHPAVDSPQALADVLCVGGEATSEPADDATAVVFHRNGIRA